MKQQDSTLMRLKLTKLLQEKKISTFTRLSITLHIAKLETKEGDKMVSELLSMIENGAKESEIRKIAQEKYQVKIEK